MGSPIQPRVRLTMVIPSWTPLTTWSRFWCRRWTIRAPMRPASMNCWMRVSRTLTSENSAAAKNALAATEEKDQKYPEQHEGDHGWATF